MSPCKKSRRTMTTTTAELPEQVIRWEILTRLPIKSAVRFKSVSKLWLSIFSDPQFVKQHLTHNIIHNPNDHDCLLAKKNNQLVMLSRYKETVALPSCNFTLVGSIRGVVCVSHKRQLALWNPAMHQYKDFSLPLQRSRDHYYSAGFGFDPLSDTYKVVVLSRDLTCASVYYSDSDNWIDISVPRNVFLKNKGFRSKNPVTIVKDRPYWTYARYTEHIEHPDKPHLTCFAGAYLTAVKFDAQSNEFKLLPQLYIDFKARGETYAFRDYEFVDMTDCLSLLVYDLTSSDFVLDIHALVEGEGCCVWRKMYSIGPLDCLWPFSQGFYGGEIVFLYRGMFLCYDHKTDTVKCLSTIPATDHYICCFRYTPSLVYLG